MIVLQFVHFMCCVKKFERERTLVKNVAILAEDLSLVPNT